MITRCMDFDCIYKYQTKLYKDEAFTTHTSMRTCTTLAHRMFGPCIHVWLETRTFSCRRQKQRTFTYTALSLLLFCFLPSSFMLLSFCNKYLRKRISAEKKMSKFIKTKKLERFATKRKNYKKMK